MKLHAVERRFYFLFNEFLSFIRGNSQISGNKRNGIFKRSKETTTFMVQ